MNVLVLIPLESPNESKKPSIYISTEKDTAQWPYLDHEITVLVLNSCQSVTQWEEIRKYYHQDIAL